jgi:hypothetical protein
LIETSCVNKEIQSYNRKLKKVVKLYKHVTILEANNNREDFTRKGLYLNKAGKRQLVMKIAKAVMEVTKEKVNNTICLDWKYVPKKPTAIRLGEKQQNHSTINNQNNKKQDDTTSRRCSTRTKKLPVHRSSDFVIGKRDLKFGRKEHNNNDDKVLNKYYTRKTPSSSSRNINFHKKPFH